MRVRFAEFTYDSEVRELLRRTKAVRISKKGFDLLGELLAHRPKARSKQQLYEKLWPETSVSDATLASLIGELRRVLVDRPREPLFIRTVHGYGYAFCAEAEAVEVDADSAEPLVFRLLVGRREVSLRSGDNLLGRTPDCTLWIDSPRASRRHAKVVVEESRAVLVDLGSRHGTFLRGKRLSAPATLKNGDTFQIGSVTLQLRIFRGAVPTDA